MTWGLLSGSLSIGICWKQQKYKKLENISLVAGAAHQNRKLAVRSHVLQRPHSSEQHLWQQPYTIEYFNHFSFSNRIEVHVSNNDMNDVSWCGIIPYTLLCETSHRFKRTVLVGNNQGLSLSESGKPGNGWQTGYIRSSEGASDVAQNHN